MSSDFKYINPCKILEQDIPIISLPRRRSARYFENDFRTIFELNRDRYSAFENVISAVRV